MNASRRIPLRSSLGWGWCRGKAWDDFGACDSKFLGKEQSEIMADKIAVSGTSDPYAVQYYQAKANDKNTISMTGYFQLLAAQLQNQDMTNPMDNSQIMAQMTQMAMVQSLTSMTEAIDTSTAVTSQTYAGGLLGQEVTIAVTEEKAGQEVPVSVKYAKVASVDFTSGNPVLRLEGDTKTYQLAHVIGIGKIPDPYADKTEGDGDKTENEGDSAEKPEGPGEGEGTDAPGGSGGAETTPSR